MVQPQKAYHKVENYERELIKEMKGMNESPVILRLFICYLKQTYRKHRYQHILSKKG